MIILKIFSYATINSFSAVNVDFIVSLMFELIVITANIKGLNKSVSSTRIVETIAYSFIFVLLQAFYIFFFFTRLNNFLLQKYLHFFMIGLSFIVFYYFYKG